MIRLLAALRRPAHHLEADLVRRAVVAAVAVELDDGPRALAALQAAHQALKRQRAFRLAGQMNLVVNRHVAFSPLGERRELDIRQTSPPGPLSNQVGEGEKGRFQARRGGFANPPGLYISN